MAHCCNTRMHSSWLSSLSLAVLIILACLTCVQGNSRKRRAGETCATKFQVFPGHTACLTKAASSTSYDLTSAEKTAILDKHNDLRGAVNPSPINMLKLSWDDETAMIAKKWVDTCDEGIYKGNSLSHDENWHRFIPARFSVGQNLAWGHVDFAAAIQAWYDEYTDYTYGLEKYSHTKVVGHYTAMVWATTFKLGCAKAQCNGNWVYACNYGPAGNIGNFKKPYESGGSSSCQKKTKGLCDCGDLECLNGSPLDPATCTCTCTSEYFLDANCKFNCELSDPFYCGSSPFAKSACYSSLATTVTQDCPHQCEVCPYADQATTPKATTPKATTPKATTPEATTPKATTPKATTPEATTPKATTPKATTPEATTPKATTPKATTPEATTDSAQATTSKTASTTAGSNPTRMSLLTLSALAAHCIYNLLYLCSQFL